MKAFGRFANAFFAEKGSQYNQNITLIEKKRSISDKYKVANIFNRYFVNITKTLTYQNGNHRKD